jgi:hypothetical protein
MELGEGHDYPTVAETADPLSDCAGEQRLNAEEGFLQSGHPIPNLDGRTVGDFWRCAYSDVRSNTTRSVFAEYIVGLALGVVNKPRVEWDSVDLRYGDFKVEVKASGYCQSWFQKKPSSILFSIRKAIFWNPATGAYEGEATRSADVYVFCVHAEREKSKANVLDVSTWEFYVVPTRTLNQAFGAAKSLSLSSVARIAVQCEWSGLKSAVDGVLEPNATLAESANEGPKSVA